VIYEGHQKITGLAFKVVGKNHVLFVATEGEIICITLLPKDKEHRVSLQIHVCHMGQSADTCVSQGQSADTCVSHGQSADTCVSHGQSADTCVSQGQSADTRVSQGQSTDISRLTHVTHVYL